MADILDRLKNRPTRTDKVTLAFKPEDGDRLAAARQRREMARILASNGDDGATELADAEATYDRLVAEIVTFTVHMAGIGPARVEELLGEHRPTEKQTRRHRRLNNGNPAGDPQFNEDTFPPALLAEVVTGVEISDSPGDTLDGLTVAEAADLWTSTWSNGDKALLLATAMNLDQNESLVEDLGKD